MTVSRYLDVAIDHGTTNSAVAMMSANGPVVLKPDGENELLPSVVFYRKDGARSVGHAARNAMRLSSSEEGEGHGGYKLVIGQDERYGFGAANKVHSPTEMGGIVIRELLNAYDRERGFLPPGCVITVPAKFDTAQCDGTREAAQKAGLQFYPLLQEPVAAAMACGFSSQNKREHWMIFDMGGGTLDVCLVMVRDGHIVVPEDGHEGDNNLGGRKLDLELFGRVLEKLNDQGYALNSFVENNQRYRIPYNKLMLAVESAKIDLSTDAQAIVHVEGVLCKDDNGKDVKVEVPVSRAEYEQLIGPTVTSALYVCDTLMRKNRLSRKEISKVILVGGPTKTPLLQKHLYDHLGIPLDNSIDPMTVVVQGAAMFAMTQELPESVWMNLQMEEATEDDFIFQVEAPRNSRNHVANISGAIDGPGADSGQMTVQLVRKDGGWSGMRIPVDKNGEFHTEVTLLTGEKPHLSQFELRLFDHTGRQVAAVAEPNIWHPYPEVDISQPSSLLIGLSNNATHLLVRAGAALPCEETDTFHTTKEMKRGSSEDVLRIPVLEAVTGVFGEEDDRQDCNLLVGELRVEGSNAGITRDLPAGSAVEVTVSVDTSRMITVRAFIEILDEEFEAVFTRANYGITLEQSETRFNQLKEQLREIRERNKRSPLEEVTKWLQTLDERKEVEEIERDFERGRGGNRESKDRAIKRTVRLAIGVNQLMNAQWAIRVQEQIKRIESSVHEQKERDNLSAVRELFDKARQSHNKEDMAAVDARLLELNVMIRLRPLLMLEIGLQAIVHAAQNNKMNNTEASGAALSIFQDAIAVHERLTKKGTDNLSDADISEAQRHFDKLENQFIRLHQWIQELLSQGGARPDISSSGIELEKR